MNIKLRAAAEVTGMIVAAGVLIAALQAMLRAATAAYGVEEVLNAMTFALMAAAAYAIVGLVYDQRVARLEYKQKLNEMIKK